MAFIHSTSNLRPSFSQFSTGQQHNLRSCTPLHPRYLSRNRQMARRSSNCAGFLTCAFFYIFDPALLCLCIVVDREQFRYMHSLFSAALVHRFLIAQFPRVVAFWFCFFDRQKMPLCLPNSETSLTWSTLNTIPNDNCDSCKWLLYNFRLRKSELLNSRRREAQGVFEYDVDHICIRRDISSLSLVNPATGGGISLIGWRSLIGYLFMPYFWSNWKEDLFWPQSISLECIHTFENQFLQLFALLGPYLFFATIFPSTLT